ncbi:MAG: DUF924 family protein [Hydrogenophaga sp.]
MPEFTQPHLSILTHWFADGLQRDWPSPNLNPRWFGGGPEEDALIAVQFGPLVESALAGGLADWETEPLPRLALVIVLDQFSRNLYRGQARAFAGDARAQTLVQQSLSRGEDLNLPTVGRVFLYMPLMHAERIDLQTECVERFTALQDSAPIELREKLEGNVQAALQHRDIVHRFGRFPHRNMVMARTSTPAEMQYLQNAPRFGQ